MKLVFGRPGRLDILIIWKIRDRFVVVPNLKDTVFGGVYGMDETSDLGFAIIAPLKDIIGYGSWGRATNLDKPS